MVSHDFGRRTIRGLPPGASAALRGGGSLAAAGVHRSIADVWRSVLAPPVHTPMPAMSAAEVRQHFGRGVLSDARPADSALFGRDVEFDLEGVRELEPEDTSAADYFGSLDCSCNDGSPAVGDPCGQGGVVTAVTPYFYAGERAPSPCMVAWTCEGGNRCECNEKLLHAGNRTCDDHGYAFDENFRCEFNGENCSCYVHCADGTWVRDAHSPHGYPLCEEDPDEPGLISISYAPGCWRTSAPIGPTHGTAPLVAKPGGETGRRYGMFDSPTTRDCVGLTVAVADFLSAWGFDDVDYGPAELDESSMVWSMDVSAVRGGLEQRCEMTVFWRDADCSDFWFEVGAGCPR